MCPRSASHDPVAPPAPAEVRASARLTHLRITPPTAFTVLDARELWERRELLYFLVWRDIKVRYKQTALGILWAVLQPLLTTAVFSLFLGRLARVPSDGIPYPLFTLAALLPWNFFAYALTDAANSLVGNASLITKVYFPRLIIPLAGVLAGTVDFSITFIIVAIMMAFYGIAPSSAILLLPLFFMLGLITAFGIGLWLAALNVQYRDIRYTLPFLTQFWLLATPVAYPSSLLNEPWRSVYGLNPMAGVVEGFRWALLGAPPPGPIVVVSALLSIALLFSAIVYFHRMERTFADVV